MQKSNLSYLTMILNKYRSELISTLSMNTSFDYSKGYVQGKIGLLEDIITDIEESIKIISE
jgi:hypothetical protein